MCAARRGTGLALVAMLVAGGCKPPPPAWPLPVSADSIALRVVVDSTDPETLVLAGYANWNREQWDSADARFRHALDYDPRYAPAHLALALLPFARYPNLERDLDRGRAPASFRDTVQEAYSHYRAAAMFDPLAEFGPPGMPPDTTRPFFLLGGGPAGMAIMGIVAYQHRNYSLAMSMLEAYRRAVPADSVPGPVLWYLALAEGQLGQYVPGVTSLKALLTKSEEMLARDTSHTPVPFLVTNDIRYTLAYFETRAGAPADAIQTYEDVLTSDLGYWMAHVRLADLRVRFRQFDQAVAERERALALRPDDDILIREYAVTLGGAGHLHEADSLLAMVAARNPWDPWTPYYRGEVAWLLGDRNTSREAYERFLAIAPPRLDSLKADVSLKLEVLK